HPAPVTIAPAPGRTAGATNATGANPRGNFQVFRAAAAQQSPAPRLALDAGDGVGATTPSKAACQHLARTLFLGVRKGEDRLRSGQACKDAARTRARLRRRRDCVRWPATDAAR